MVVGGWFGELLMDDAIIARVGQNGKGVFKHTQFKQPRKFDSVVDLDII